MTTLFSVKKVISRGLPFTLALLALACSGNSKSKHSDTTAQEYDDLRATLDTIWKTEQEPIRLRDSLGRVFGFESEEFNKQQEIVRRNHQINEQKIIAILDSKGWPSEAVIGAQGNLTICNVIQHSANEIRLKYLPMMRKAVKEKKLHPRLLARAEDRLATDQGKLQIYGGQIKYYPETKSFDVWPIADPENVDKRRADIGLEPIAEFLKSRRVPLEWNLEDQLRRTEAFVAKQEKAN